MTREEFIEKIDLKLKLIRNERNYTQDKMAEVIGISKKTLVQVEKGRGSLGWTGAVALCTLFKDSEVLQMTLGGDGQEIIACLAFERSERSYIKTMGGKVWWMDIAIKGDYKLQQNIISNHYRILDNENRRIAFSFDLDYMNNRLEELNNQ